jgi:hypothetical protein
MIDIDRMRRIAEGLYVGAVHNAFGHEGSDGLKALMEALVQIYRRIDPSLRRHGLIVFQRLAATGSGDYVVAPIIRIAGPSRITHELDGPCSVEIVGNGDLAVRPFDAVDPKATSTEAIVYVFGQSKEYFWINGVAYNIINPSPSHASIFSRPTFSSLHAALEDYRVRVARETSCEILGAVWADDQRLFFRTKPEATMRKSLNQFLSHVLQDAEVKPEQNVDETHPVDIKITWSLTEQRAIIEIKWIGDSLGAGGEIVTRYRESRARDGAEQLADYLDKSATWAASVRTQGYLVVFDARRRGNSPSRGTIGRDDGLYYRDLEVDYKPDFAAQRSDFHRPIRCFMNPIISAT